MIGIEVLSHDGPARLGRFNVGEGTVSTPSACYLAGVRDGVRFFEIGDGAGIRLAIPPRAGVWRRTHRESTPRGESMIRASYLGEDGVDGGLDCLVVDAGRELPDAIEARCLVMGETHGGRLSTTVERLIELREASSPNAAIIVPNARVWEVPLLALAGGDIFCDSHPVGCTLSGRMLFESYFIPAEDCMGSCNCPHCSGGKGDADALGKHNRWIFGRALSETRNRIRIEEIKHLAEERAVGHPETMAALKLLYRNHVQYLEEYTTIRPGVES